MAQRTKLRIIPLGLAVVFSIIWWLPISELLSTAQFRLIPSQAKLSHFLRYIGPQQNVIYLLGTTHDLQFKSSGYPYWELRSVIENVRPSLILVEIRPDSMLAGKWGEGPPEMPYVVALANESGIPVQGMDYWHKGDDSPDAFDHREDEMAKNILSEANGAKDVLIFTGYSHIAGLSRRLTANGYQRDDTFSNDKKNEKFQGAVNHFIPASYFEAVSAAVLEVQTGRSDYSTEWTERRNELLAHLKTLRAVGH